MKKSSDLNKRIASLRDEVFLHMRGRPLTSNKPIKPIARKDFISLIMKLKKLGDTRYEILDEPNNICALYFNNEEIGRAYYRIKTFYVQEEILKRYG